MIASHICKDLYEWILNGERKGTIHSIFKNSINILGEDKRLISIIAEDKPISPNGIKVKNNVFFNSLNIDIGEKGTFTRTSYIMKYNQIYYGNGILWDKKINLSYKKDNLENLLLKIKLLEDFLFNKGNRDGIFTLLFCLSDRFNFWKNHIFDQNVNLGKNELFIRDRFLELINSFENSELEKISINAKKIIGFGLGLTPSMDDFISGMMIANIYLTHFLEMDLRLAYKINSQIIKDIENRTTVVSEEMLKFSSTGESNEDIRHLMIALLGEYRLEEINDLFMQVAKIGESSGTDILCGIYIGCLMLLSKNKR